MSVPRAVVIGIGNPCRRDDGIGPALIAALRPSCPDGITLAVSNGEPSHLLEVWDQAPLAVVVDAVLCEPPAPGRIHRSSALPGRPAAAGSTHGLGVPDAIRLAQALDRGPRQLVVLAVEAADLATGPGLSPAVAASLPRLARAVLDEVDRVRPDPRRR